MQTVIDNAVSAGAEQSDNGLSLLEAAKAMTQGVSASPTPTRGRPRSAEAGRRLLKTTLDVVEKIGYVNFTVDEVARRSGIPKSTMYRRWDSKGEMLAEALFSEVSYNFSDEELNTGSLRGDLERYFQLMLASSSTPRYKQASLGVMIEAQLNPAVADMLRKGMMQPRRESLLRILQRGVERGELSSSVNQDVMMDMLLGSVWYRTLINHAALDDGFIGDLIDASLS